MVREGWKCFVLHAGLLYVVVVVVQVWCDVVVLLCWSGVKLEWDDCWSRRVLSMYYDFMYYFIYYFDCFDATLILLQFYFMYYFYAT